MSFDICEHHRVHIASLTVRRFVPLNDSIIVLQWCAHPDNDKYGKENVTGPIPPMERRLFCDGRREKSNCPMLPHLFRAG